MSNFTVTVHALDRMEQRFPRLVDGMSDQEIATFIHGEVMDALEDGRFAKVPPIELASNDLVRHLINESEACWTEDKARGYIFVESGDGITVKTVLTGKSRVYAMRKFSNRLGKKLRK